MFSDIIASGFCPICIKINEIVKKIPSLTCRGIAVHQIRVFFVFFFFENWIRVFV